MDATIFICDKAGTVELCIYDHDAATEHTVATTSLNDVMDGVTVEVVTKTFGYHDTCDIVDSKVLAWWDAEKDVRQELIYDTVGEWANKLGYEVANIEHV